MNEPKERDVPLPEPGIKVLAWVEGNDAPICAMWVPKFYLEDSGAHDDFGEYNEADDTYYWPEGWYENNRYEETNWLVQAPVDEWRPLPVRAGRAARATEAEQVAQWQKKHPLRTRGWENTNEHDAKWWATNSMGWEIRALYAAPPAALRLDAARYAWLRDQHWVEPEATFRLGLSDSDDSSNYHRELDAAIDAAMAARATEVTQVNSFIASMEPLGSEFQQVLNENLWDLYEKTPPAAQPLHGDLLQAIMDECRDIDSPSSLSPALGKRLRTALEAHGITKEQM